MPNYSLVVNSKFTPTDYASLLAPIFSDYGTRWNTKYEKALLELLDRLVLKLLIELEEDPDLKALYAQYENKFNDFFDSFDRGYDSNTEKLGLEANRLYNESIVPILREMTKRSKYIDELRTLRRNNDTLMFDTDFRDVKISDMLENPNMSYNSYSGEAIREKTSKAVEALSNSYYGILNNPNSVAKDNTTDLYLLDKLLKGFSLEQILATIENDESAPDELKNLKESIRDAYGYNDITNLDIRNHIDHYINEGLYSGVGEVEQKWLTNQNYQSDAYKDKLNADVVEKAEKDATIAEEKEKKALLELIKENKAKRVGSGNGWDISIKGSIEDGDRMYTAEKDGEATIASSNYDDFMYKLAKSGVNGLASSIMTDPNSMFLGRIHETKDDKGNPVYYDLLDFESLDKETKKHIGRDSQAFESNYRFDTPIYEDPNSYKPGIGTESAIQGSTVVNGDALNAPQIESVLNKMIDNNPNIVNLIINNQIYLYLAEKGANELVEDGTISTIQEYNEAIQDVYNQYQSGGYKVDSLNMVKYAIQLGMLKLVKIPSRNKNGLGDYFLIKQ